MIEVIFLVVFVSVVTCFIVICPKKPRSEEEESSEGF